MRLNNLTVLLICLLPAALQAAVLAPATVPADELQDKIIHRKKFGGRAKQSKSRKAQSVKQAYEALQSKKFALARKLAVGLETDRYYADYGYWIKASSWLGEGRFSFQAKKYTDTITLAQKAIAASHEISLKSPYSPHLKTLSREVGLAEILLGSAFCGTSKWDSCKTNFENGLQRLVMSGDLGQVRPENLLLYSQACLKSPSDMCAAWIQKFSQFFTRGSPEIRAVAKFHPGAAERAHPAILVGKASQSYKSPDMDFKAFDDAMSRYLDQKYGDAAKSLRTFLDDFPKSVFRFRARFWLGQALSHDQKHEDAQKINNLLQQDSPLTYYGLLASLTGGKSIDSSVSGTVPLAAATDPFLTPQELFRLKRAESFVSENAFDLAAIELKELRPRDALSSPFLMYLAMLNYEATNYNQAFIILNELIQRNYEGVLSTFTLRLIFPVRYMDLIEKSAEEFKLDPILLLSLIKQESAFDSGVSSGVGAFGLMQLMPTTAAEVSPELSRADLITPEANIRTGAKYLARLLGRFNGNIALALAGYNAGPNAADRWYRASPPKRGMLEFIETIPYKETREYVAAIIRNYYWYSKNLNEDTPRTLAYFWGTPAEGPATVVKAEKKTSSPTAPELAKKTLEPSPLPSTTVPAPVPVINTMGPNPAPGASGLPTGNPVPTPEEINGGVLPTAPVESSTDL